MVSIEVLRSFPYFAGVSAESLKAVAAITEERAFPAGQPLFKEDDPARALYILREGQVDIVYQRHVDEGRVVRMCLLHDLPESRTGDLNYVNKQYVQVREDQVVRDLARTLPFGGEIEELLSEFREGKSRESLLAHDSDQLDLILELKEHLDLGNRYATQWIHFARQRLKTDLGRQLASEITETDSTAWWFEGRDHWWTID